MDHFPKTVSETRYADPAPATGPVPFSALAILSSSELLMLSQFGSHGTNLSDDIVFSWKAYIHWSLQPKFVDVASGC